MQCDAINSVSSENYTKANSDRSDDDTTREKKKSRKIRKYPKCFHMMAKKKTERLSFVLQKLPWQKEFQHFVPLSKKRKKERKKEGRKKEAPHDSICFLCSSNSLFHVYRNNLHTFFPPRPTLLPDSLLVVDQGMCLAKEECFLMERNKIESTRQILEPNDFQTPHGQEWVYGRRWHGNFTRLK